MITAEGEARRVMMSLALPTASIGGPGEHEGLEIPDYGDQANDDVRWSRAQECESIYAL